MRPLTRRALVVQDSPVLGFTLTALGVEVVEALEAEWTDHVEEHFGDTSDEGRMEQGDKARALASMVDRRAMYARRAEREVARMESRLASAKADVALLQGTPFFNHDITLNQEGA